jgi:hypothetical protein
MVAGVGIENFPKGESLFWFSGKGGQKGERAPAIGGMLAGEPNRFTVLDDEKNFPKGGGLGA